MVLTCLWEDVWHLGDPVYSLSDVRTRVDEVIRASPVWESECDSISTAHPSSASGAPVGGLVNLQLWPPALTAGVALAATARKSRLQIDARLGSYFAGRTFFSASTSRTIW